MVKLKLARFGAKKQPYYRIVAANAQGKREGRFLELLGTYDPRKDPPAVTLAAERVRYWLSVGAKPTDAVSRILHYNLGEGVPHGRKAVSATDGAVTK